MGDKTGIQWTDATWNPWHGCIKISPGCKYCYMYRDKKRYRPGRQNWGPGNPSHFGVRRRQYRKEQHARSQFGRRWDALIARLNIFTRKVRRDQEGE